MPIISYLVPKISRSEPNISCACAKILTFVQIWREGSKNCCKRMFDRASGNGRAGQPGAFLSIGIFTSRVKVLFREGEYNQNCW